MSKVLLIDCDGVLTDGTLTIDHTGKKLFKTFHTRDVRAIRELVANGWQVVIVTADDWEGTHAFASKVGAECLAVRDKSKVPFLDYAAVGDDAWDVGMLKKARYAFIPYDADPSVRVLGATKLSRAGGRGCIAELVPILFNLYDPSR